MSFFGGSHSKMLWNKLPWKKILKLARTKLMTETLTWKGFSPNKSKLFLRSLHKTDAKQSFEADERDLHAIYPNFKQK